MELVAVILCFSVITIIVCMGIISCIGAVNGWDLETPLCNFFAGLIEVASLAIIVTSSSVFGYIIIQLVGS